MKKRYALVFLFLVTGLQLQAQQFGLFNSNTLFDAFENPAQRAFTADDSRPFASNFLFPYLSVNGNHKGDGSYTLQHKINEGDFDTRNIPIGTKQRNRLYGNTNAYLLMFRFNPFYQNNKELGISWQLRADAYGDYTNESLVAIRNYGRFTGSMADPFNGKGYAQSYHQFSASYRVDYDEGIAFGLKLGVLSGITYNKAEVTASDLIRSSNNLSVSLTGRYKASFLETAELERDNLVPDFKNPGIAASFGTSYTSPSGVTIIGNIKDLGFIRWNKNAVSARLEQDLITLNAGTAGNSKELQQKLITLVKSKDEHEAFYSATNAKIDFLISKTFGFYTPNLIISKNLFYHGADVVLVNNFKVDNLSFGISPAFNMNQFLLIGAQALYRSSNFEFFAGTDNLLKSASFSGTDAYQSKRVIGASAYMGIGIKFGYTPERP